MNRSFLIVVATDSELRALKNLFKIKDEQQRSLRLLCSDRKLTYFEVTDDGNSYTITKSGVGKGAMCFTLGAFLTSFKFDLVINAGVAGALDHKLNKMTTLVADRTAFYDVDLTEIDSLPLGQLDGMPRYFACDRKFIEIAQKAGFRTGLILSGDRFLTNKNMPKELMKQFDDPLAVDMESAAVGEACHIAGVPFGIIRTISDDTEDEENQVEYYSELNDACERTVAELINLLKMY